MRCPKCSYLSYEDVTRCRNCGYDFALAVPPAAADAPTLDAHVPSRPWEDGSSRAVHDPADDMGSDDESSAVDLPLFEPSDDAASAAPPSVPPEPERPRERPLRRPAPAAPLDPPPVHIPPAAPPLVVRRTVDVARPAPGASPPHPRQPRPRHTPPPALDFDRPGDEVSPGADELADGLEPEVPSWDRTRAVGDDETVALPPSGGGGAGLGRRIAAGAVDSALLLGIDALVVWLTLRLLGLTWADWTQLALWPLLGFVVLLDLSYLVTFTAASGQTIGKMLAGLRVVTETGARVPFGHAVVRSVLVLVAALPAGLGLIPVLFNDQGRGVHDRIAGTRIGPAE